MAIPIIDTNFLDNDKYWYDVGAAYTLHVYDILQNSQIGNDRRSNNKLFENYVDKRSDVIRLAVTDKSCDYLDTKVMVAYSRTAARKDSGEPSEDDVKLEKIWDKA